ncbi:scavenger receptor class F member 2-like isoform X1 [Haliotis rubra]|uniref:scavenger receptor class F member 2-like isoform X1 n=2 Tax=Haliotis rubra TaxID=36100 RepID=UPI001EE52879|nr:scavenger receptor class F member 2-like isoform X1 [Haliotis rubra]XP_046565015.1 scavenger receptor class F member 2-like isoform X1 [Haliotis rubra]XP_046565016.1 scavenger receptor class F member 2-like isoform X1 [Haliotis rubra]XP_046565017.1 scavenger receptor class F member 2-like isoform X1 [Haliotis rubra]XP_046565018.1 scavenger receptor class F member 2-like isoform X1 [Haliotis rubra]
MCKSTLFTVLVIQLVCCGTSAKVCSESRCTLCKRGTCEECLYGYWGSQCEHACVSCWMGGCHKHTGRCRQCLPGRYTEGCDTLCPSTCRLSYDNVRYCHRTSGKCLEGCAEGWWGSTCNETCGQGCKKKACYQEDGVCISDCMEGWHGRKCDKHNCLNRHVSGRCTDGCKDGWIGAVCSERCGADCMKCHQFSSAYCLVCKPGLYGPDCQSECSANCVNTTCNMAGQCENGCMRGFHGRKCEMACPYRCLDCDQTSGNCRMCEIGWTGLQCLDQPVSYATSQPDTPELTSGCNQMAEVKLTTFAMMMMSAVHHMSSVLER